MGVTLNLILINALSALISLFNIVILLEICKIV